MEIKKENNGDISFVSYHDNYCNTQAGDRKHIGLLAEFEQRELLQWFMKNRPSLIFDAVCEKCKELEDYHNFCENKFERGK